MKGDFLTIDFVGRVAQTGEVFDLTVEDVAKKEGVYQKGHTYKPVLVVIGGAMILPAVERVLDTMKVGEEKELTVSPQEGFGERKPAMIRVVSLAKFKDKNITPVPGLFVDIDGMRAKIQSVSGGRVRLDFNHPLAGKELTYWVKVVSKITDLQKKAQALLDYFRIDATATAAGKKVTITTDTPLVKQLQEVLEKSIKEHLPGVTVVFAAVKKAAEQEN